jgi:hypothetical protein
VVGELLNDRPALASCELAADAELIRDRGVALIVGGVPRVDRNFIAPSPQVDPAVASAVLARTLRGQLGGRACERTLAAVHHDDRSARLVEPDDGASLKTGS